MHRKQAALRQAVQLRERDEVRLAEREARFGPSVPAPRDELSEKTAKAQEARRYREELKSEIGRKAVAKKEERAARLKAEAEELRSYASSLHEGVMRERQIERESVEMHEAALASQTMIKKGLEKLAASQKTSSIM